MPNGAERAATRAHDRTMVLRSLISPVVAQTILDDDRGPGEDFATPVPSIVLCADLSGFSIAGAVLTRSEARGAEELRSIVNTVFGSVTDAIQSAGGQILQFSGDAVTAVWPTATASADQVLCAISAGLVLQDACRNVSVAGMAELKMRVSLAQGAVWIAHMADGAAAPDIVICGDVFDAFRGGGAFREGVLLDPALWATVSAVVGSRASVVRDVHRIRIVGLKGSVPATTPPDIGPAVTARISAYVPPYLRDLVQGVATDWLAEFRSAQILFARFPGFRFRGPGDLSALAKLAAGVRQSVDENGGVRLKFGCDDKGLILLAAWGLQLRSFEDNAERALTAAAHIHEAARGAGMDAGIGVTGGKVFAGLVGSDRHREYTVIGDPVNRAAAMSDGAAGQTRVDAPTRTASAGRFRFADAGIFSLKGQEAAAQSVLLDEAPRQSDPQSDMVGRATERAQVDGLVAALVANRLPGLLHVVGEAGLGKSRLAGYLHAGLIAAGIVTWRMNADSLRRTTSYYPWRQIIGAVIGPDVSADDLAGMLTHDPAMAELVPLLSPVLRTAIPDTAFTANLFGGGRAEKTQGVITALLAGRIGGGAQVLIVEDAHWLDSASWQLLERVARTYPQMVVALVSRPLDRDALPFEARRLLDRPDATVIRLAPMTRADSAALVNAALQVVESAPAIVDLIYHHAEGHPLFTGALALSLREQGLLRIEAGFAHLRLGEKGMMNIAFPDGVEGVVAERIAALPPARQLTLKVAAVLGRSFDLDLLAQLHPAGADTAMLADDIAAATRAGLLEPSDGATGRHRFHHAIIGDTAYRLLVSEQRRGLHARTANLLDAKAAADGYPAATLALLAHHFEQADLHGQAVDFLSRAAESARSGYNNAEVVDFLTRALRIADAQPQLATRITRGNWNHKIADALKALGHYQRAAEFLFESARLLDRAPPTSTRGALVTALGGYAGYRLRPHRRPRPSERRDPMIAAAEINMTLSEIHYELNKVPFSLAEVLRAVNLARSGGGDSTTLAKIYMGMALISRALPRALDGNDLQAKSIDIAERLGDLPTISWVYMASGVFEMGKCGWASGEAHFHRSMTVSDLCGERKNWETSMSSLGNLKRVEGWFEQALACSNATLAAARDRDISHSIAWSHNGRLRDLLCLNRLDEARDDSAILNGILNDPKKKGDTNDNSNVVDGYARALLALVDGDIARARAGLDDAAAVIRGMNRPQVYMVQNVSFLCDTVWNLWRQTGDKALLAHSALVAKYGARMARQYSAGKPSAALAAGDAAWYRGDRPRAAQHWLASAAASADRGMRFNQAQALFRLDDTGCLPAAAPGPGWAALLEQIGMSRPDIWSLART